MNTLFKQNKYTKWYYNIVSAALNCDRIKGKDTYYEKHHIIPKSFSGSNSKDNLVLLTAREHYMCHLLLPQMMVEPIKAGKMVYAFVRMKHKCKNSKMFDRFRVAYGKLTAGENNPFYGRKHTAEYIANMSGENHPMYNKKHRPDSLLLMRQVKLGHGIGQENPMWGKTHPEEWRKNHSAALTGEKHFNYGKDAFTKGRVWMNNTIQSKMIKPEEVLAMSEQGWSKGRLPK